MGPHLFDFEESLFLWIILPVPIAMWPCCVIACCLPPSRLKGLESKQETSLLCESRRIWSTNSSLLKETPEWWEHGKGLKFSSFLLLSPTSCIWLELRSPFRWKETPWIEPGSRKRCDGPGSTEICWRYCWDVYLGQTHRSRSHCCALF